MDTPTFLFPAFVLKYKGNEVDIIKKYGVDFNEKLFEIKENTGVDITDFDILHNSFLDDEQKNQMISYLISCIFSDILKSQSIKPDYVSFLSMGIYSALYCTNSISFDDGAKIIKRVYELLNKQFCDKNYRMLAITGLSRNDIINILNKKSLNCEIVIKNNDHSFIIVGKENDINILLNAAKEEGAIQLNIFPVSIPYHSKQIDSEGFEDIIFEGIEVKNPSYKLFSSINQKQIDNSGKVKTEILNNLFTNIDWHKTNIALIKQGVHEFVECGPGDSLKRISRFFDGDFNVYGMSKLV